MKQKLLIFFVCISAFSFAQDTFQDNEPRAISARKNEVRVGAVKLLMTKSIDLQYERMIDNATSFGINTLIGLQDKKEEQGYRFSMGGFFRMYFNGDNQYGNKGFFIDAFVDHTLGKSKERKYDYVGSTDYTSVYKRYHVSSAGLGLGYKWLNRTGFSIQPSGKIGPKLSGSDFAPKFTYNLALSLGYRF